MVNAASVLERNPEHLDGVHDAERKKGRRIRRSPWCKPKSASPRLTRSTTIAPSSLAFSVISRPAADALGAPEVTPRHAVELGPQFIADRPSADENATSDNASLAAMVSR